MSCSALYRRSTATVRRYGMGTQRIVPSPQTGGNLIVSGGHARADRSRRKGARTMSGPDRRTMITGGLSALVASSARANPDWPERPVTIVHGFPPGGPTDLIARIVADGLTRRLGQRVLVEGKPGASGTTAAAQVARAAPDGYTLFATPSGHAFVAATFKTLPYRTVEDFSPVSMLTEFPYLLATHADHSMRTVQDLVELARSRPTPLLAGTPGNGSGPHRAGELRAT